MSPAFERPESTSSKQEQSEEPVNSQEAMKTAETSVEDFLTQINEVVAKRIEEDPTAHFKGRGWELSELPDEYERIAFAQKKLDVIEEELTDILEKNQDTQPGSAEEAVSYFKAQLLARTQEVQEKQAALQAQQLGLKLQHPDIYNALNSDKPE